MSETLDRRDWLKSAALLGASAAGLPATAVAAPDARALALIAESAKG